MAWSKLVSGVIGREPVSILCLSALFHALLSGQVGDLLKYSTEARGNVDIY
mgnify:CR=1 FL=1|jgi:hypothetical protein